MPVTSVIKELNLGLPRKIKVVVRAWTELLDWASRLHYSSVLTTLPHCRTIHLNLHNKLYNSPLSVTVGIIHGFLEVKCYKIMFYHVPTFSINQQHNFFTQSFGCFSGG